MKNDILQLSVLSLAASTALEPRCRASPAVPLRHPANARYRTEPLYTLFNA